MGGRGSTSSTAGCGNLTLRGRSGDGSDLHLISSLQYDLCGLDDLTRIAINGDSGHIDLASDGNGHFAVVGNGRE